MPGKESHKIDLNLIGAPMELMSAYESGETTPDIEISIVNSVYGLKTLTGSTVGGTVVTILRNLIEGLIYMLWVVLYL